MGTTLARDRPNTRTPLLQLTNEFEPHIISSFRTNLVRIFNVVPLPTLFEHNALFRGIPVGLLLMQASNFLSYLSLRESSLDSTLSLLPFSGFFPGFSRSTPQADNREAYDTIPSSTLLAVSILNLWEIQGLTPQLPPALLDLPELGRSGSSLAADPASGIMLGSPAAPRFFWLSETDSDSMPGLVDIPDWDESINTTGGYFFHEQQAWQAPHSDLAFFHDIRLFPDLLGFGVHVIFNDGEFLDWGCRFAIHHPQYFVSNIIPYPRRIFLPNSAARAASIIFPRFQIETTLLYFAFSLWRTPPPSYLRPLLRLFYLPDNCIEILLGFVFTAPTPSILFVVDRLSSPSLPDEIFLFPLLSRGPSHLNFLQFNFEELRSDDD
jgi:hypothetical protein